MSYGHGASIITGMIINHPTEFSKLYSGERAVLGEALIAHDPGDQFGWCQEWRFAIADTLYDRGEYVPGFRQSSGGPDTDSYAYQAIEAIAPTTDALLYAFNVLGRFREWLRLNGEDD